MISMLLQWILKYLIMICKMRQPSLQTMYIFIGIIPGLHLMPGCNISPAWGWWWYHCKKPSIRVNVKVSIMRSNAASRRQAKVLLPYNTQHYNKDPTLCTRISIGIDLYIYIYRPRLAVPPSVFMPCIYILKTVIFLAIFTLLQQNIAHLNTGPNAHPSKLTLCSADRLFKQSFPLPVVWKSLEKAQQNPVCCGIARC